MLENEVVMLKPLAREDAAALFHAGNDERIWEMTQPRIHSLSDAEAYIDKALAATDQRTFAVFSKVHNQIVGATRFYTIDEGFGSVEIGYTWLNPMVWRSAVNTNMKLLMLTYAFEQWSMKRVQIMADERNIRSRNAIVRIGATFEGILRKHKFGADGAIRNSAVYSIIDDEWPDVKQHIENKL